MAASHQASGNVFQPPLGTNAESQENHDAHRTLVGVQQPESNLPENRILDRHLFKEQRGVCLSPKRGLFLGALGTGALSSPGLLSNQLNEGFHHKAQTTSVSKLPAFQG